MEHEKLYTLFQNLSEGKILPKEALQQIQKESYSDLGFAKIDHGRKKRLGFPEVIFSESKTVEQLEKICKAHLKVHDNLLLTRLSIEKNQELEKNGIKGHYNSTALTLSIASSPLKQVGNILILCAGTSDLKVAEEAEETARIMGNKVDLVADVGVAGLHRLLDKLDQLKKAKVVIVVAGMEGALASVVGGLVHVPVIAVPTSVGYGASFKGVAALLSMLNCCAPGVTVVNIDNGFGAAFAAGRINNPIDE